MLDPVEHEVLFYAMFRWITMVGFHEVETSRHLSIHISSCVILTVLAVLMTL